MWYTYGFFLLLHLRYICAFLADMQCLYCTSLNLINRVCTRCKRNFSYIGKRNCFCPFQIKILALTRTLETHVKKHLKWLSNVDPELIWCASASVVQFFISARKIQVTKTASNTRSDEKCKTSIFPSDAWLGFALFPLVKILVKRFWWKEIVSKGTQVLNSILFEI